MNVLTPDEIAFLNCMAKNKKPSINGLHWAERIKNKPASDKIFSYVCCICDRIMCYSNGTGFITSIIEHGRMHIDQHKLKSFL